MSKLAKSVGSRVQNSLGLDGNQLHLLLLQVGFPPAWEARVSVQFSLSCSTIQSLN